jgi:hypothetical protein
MTCRVIAFVLIAESLFGALYVSNLVPYIASYDIVTAVLIMARGVLGALQFTGGWLLANRRPAGRAIARWALVGGALFMILAVGFNLAPTSIYYWYRWHVTAVYAFYAIAATILLQIPKSNGSMDR